MRSARRGLRGWRDRESVPGGLGCGTGLVARQRVSLYAFAMGKSPTLDPDAALDSLCCQWLMQWGGARARLAACLLRRKPETAHGFGGRSLTLDSRTTVQAFHGGNEIEEVVRGTDSCAVSRMLEEARSIRGLLLAFDDVETASSRAHGQRQPLVVEGGSAVYLIERCGVDELQLTLSDTYSVQGVVVPVTAAQARNVRVAVPECIEQIAETCPAVFFTAFDNCGWAEVRFATELDQPS